MTRFALAAALLAAAQDVDLKKQAARCGAGIAWISDGHQLRDAESISRPVRPEPFDRDGLMRQAQERAAKGRRLILWHVIRVPGRHMNRAHILDRYMQATLFSDPAVEALVNAKFIPLRMASDRRLDVKAFEFVEPGFLFLDPDGKVLHRVDRIRTFSPAWMIHLLRSVLRKHPEFNAPAGEDAEALIRGGDYEEALKRLEDPARRAAVNRLLRRREPPAEGIERAWVALHSGDFSGAEKAAEKIASPEAEYLRSLVEFYTAREKEAVDRWKKLAREDHRWAFKSALNLVTERDTLPMGPTPHSFEDVFWAPEEAYVELPRDTRWPREDLQDAARRAVQFLLRNQRSNGGFEDSRYVYCPSPKILPNVFVAATSLAAAALLEWRRLDPERIDAAVARAEAYLLDEARLNRGQNEEIYADAYRLIYLSKKPEPPVETMSGIVKKLAGTQNAAGWWAHEYPNPFCTAAVMQALAMAKKAGARGIDPLLERACGALQSTRGKNGRQAYQAPMRPSGAKDSMARSAMCEGALMMAGRAGAGEVEAALGEYWEHLNRLQAVRVCDFHADGELGGFFYWHGVFHASEAAMLLESRREHMKKFRAQVLAIPEIDGSFIDSHELGKCYGTAMALLVLRNCVRAEDEH
jgi:hypothetical protein